MTDVVPAEDIERIVGVPRHPLLHIARAVSAEQRVYVLHSHRCLTEHADLRLCPFSLALDNGIFSDEWTEDEPVAVTVVNERLTPRPGEPAAADYDPSQTSTGVDAPPEPSLSDDPAPTRPEGSS